MQVNVHFDIPTTADTPHCVAPDSTAVFFDLSEQQRAVMFPLASMDLRRFRPEPRLRFRALRVLRARGTHRLPRPRDRVRADVGLGPEDIAIWGLASAAAPRRIHIIPATGGRSEAIVCADANPVHQYELRPDGWFRGVGGPCPWFEMKIERHGLMHELRSRGTVRESLFTRRSESSRKAELLDEMRPFLVPEASSDDTQFYLAPTRPLEVDPKLQQMVLYELVTR